MARRRPNNPDPPNVPGTLTIGPPPPAPTPNTPPSPTPPTPDAKTTQPAQTAPARASPTTLPANSQEHHRKHHPRRNATTNPGYGSLYPPPTICTTSDTITSTNRNTDNDSLTNNRHPLTAASHQSRYPPSMPPTNAAPRTTLTPETGTSTPGRAVNGTAAHGTAYTHHRHHHPARGQEPPASPTAATSTDTTNTTTAGRGLPTIQEHLHHQQPIHHPRHPTIANATTAPITPPPPEATWATPPVIHSTLATTATSGPQTLRPNDQKQHPHYRHHRQHHIRPYVTRAMLTNHHLVIRGTNTTGDDESDNS